MQKQAWSENKGQFGTFHKPFLALAFASRLTNALTYSSSFKYNNPEYEAPPVA